MPETLYISEDMQEFKNKFEPRYGVCGLSCLSVLLQKSHKETISLWEGLVGQYKGFAKRKEMRSFLEQIGFEVKQRNARKGLNIVLTPKHLAFANIQWKGKDGGDFHGYTSWHEASCNTHYIVITEHHVFCNSIGWFSRAKLIDYLKEREGYITSYLEIKNPIEVISC